ncbi:MAG: 2-oxoglutarate dehydrogenase [Ignavibacteria bacterium]|nr:2-oxoglutarate dehydrogenase [Ignavibacteria bacterium]NCS80200.1 2-oxoglutarate dehydrogenase [Ignavibacteria bacterium]OIO15998.1 MAG: 2-oxoglutarate dehydrogenase [Ignavibacteria bacterium CG1_02_37_35]
MKVEIPMPKMGESIMEGTILKWHKKVGERIRKDEILFEISTDKVDSEIPSPVDGIVTALIADEGATLDVGKIVAYIESNENRVLDEVNSSSKKEVMVSGNMKKKISEEEMLITPSQQKIDIPMPKMGESVMEGTIIKWYKKPGEAVKLDEILFEISTDKVDTEVPSPVNGTLSEILVKEQETVEVGTIVARVFSTELLHQTEVQHENSIEAGQMHAVIGANSLPADALDEKEKESNRFYSPLVMNIAKKEKVSFDELEKIPGSGINKRVTKNDLLSYLQKREAHHISQVEPVDVQETHPFTANLVERMPMDNIRLKIMQHMIKSRDTSVHVSAMVEVDITKIYNFIKVNKERYQNQKGVKLTYMAFVSDAVIKSLKAFPVVNASIEGTTILQKRFINLGIAVALEPNGLIVPNIKNAHDKNIFELAKAITELAEKARTKKLSPDDVTNGTFSISNYGVFGTIFGTPIINQPEVAILGVGAVIKKPVVVEVDGMDTIAIKPIMNLAITHDHRLVDGMVGGKFLSFIKEKLERFDEKTDVNFELGS